MSTNFLITKVCWQCSAIFCLYTSSKLSRPKFDFTLKVKVMGSNPSYLLKSFLLYNNPDIRNLFWQIGLFGYPWRVFSSQGASFHWNPWSAKIWRQSSPLPPLFGSFWLQAENSTGSAFFTQIHFPSWNERTQVQKVSKIFEFLNQCFAQLPCRKKCLKFTKPTC